MLIAKCYNTPPLLCPIFCAFCFFCGSKKSIIQKAIKQSPSCISLKGDISRIDHLKPNTKNLTPQTSNLNHHPKYPPFSVSKNAPKSISSCLINPLPGNVPLSTISITAQIDAAVVQDIARHWIPSILIGVNAR